MRVSPLVSEFFEWRWAPCVGLTAGSLAFVALALLLIPTQFDGAPASSSLASVSPAFDRPESPAPQRALFGASLARSLPGIGRNSDQASPPPRPARVEPVAVSEPAPQRGFSPVIDRPEPPPPPPPPPPPAPVVEAAPAPAPAPVPVATPPAPAPDANVIVQQPEPDGPRREVTVP
jgi:hypothetical protein